MATHETKPEGYEETGFSKALKYYRLRAGLVQKVLAERAAVSQSQISRWESGENIPDPDDVSDWFAIERLAATLHVDPALLGGGLVPETGSTPQRDTVPAREKLADYIRRFPSGDPMVREMLRFLQWSEGEMKALNDVGDKLLRLDTDRNDQPAHIPSNTETRNGVDTDEERDDDADEMDENAAM